MTSTSPQTTFTSCMHDQMLESNRDEVKLEAMRCITVMTAKGKFSVPRTLFPQIVKNVSSTNPELKKLIYLYLTFFADQEPDLALLPVATLQKSLNSPNPLTRSSALKVLTSMRLNILSAILMKTIRSSVNDLSPYVRKTVAHSIIKIYRLDPSLREDLIEYVDRLFNDKNSMVLSSAVITFQLVCPERLDLVQKHYRRFCLLLADCNEWGQTLMLNLLGRYLRETTTIDQDPRILLRAAKPLIHSNNSAVVMAVIKLFVSLADQNEVRSTVIRPLIMLLNSHRETQLIVLDMIENLTNPTSADQCNRSESSHSTESDDEEETNEDQKGFPDIFRPFVKSFFVKHTDCTQIRLLKLKILTNLSSPVNVSLILRELQAYISSYVDDRKFVSAAIHAIGICALIVSEVATTCLNRLTSLLSNNNEHIVSEAIVVLRSQIINRSPESSNKNSADDQATENGDEDDNMVSAVIKQVTKLLPSVTAPHARATILWILAEFCAKNITAAKCAPNVLRQIAKSFCHEDNLVKLQSLTLAYKFLLSLDKEEKPELHAKIQLLSNYLFSLAKYDINHDVRDRGRLLRKLLEKNINLCLT